MMNIALVSSGRIALPPKSGGAVELYVYELARTLRKLGVKAWAIDRKWHVNYYEDNDAILRLDIPNLLDSQLCISILGRTKCDILKELIFGLNAAKAICKLDMNPDILHLNTVWTALAMTLLPPGKAKIVYTSHNGAWFKEELRSNEKVPLLIERFIMQRADAVIVLCNTMKSFIVKKTQIDPSKIFVIPNGVDTEFLRPGLKCKEIMKGLGLNENLVVLFVGRILPSKGVHILLKALKILKNKYKLNPKTVIAGHLSGTYGDDTPSQYTRILMKYAKKNELNVAFLGATSRNILRYLYSCSQVLVLPSYFEAFPMVLIEALASGCPVIGSNVGGIPDIIEDGVDGFLLEKGNAEDLAKKLYTILSDKNLTKKMSMNAREIAVRKYDWTIVASKIINVYNWVMFKDIL